MDNNLISSIAEAILNKKQGEKERNKIYERVDKEKQMKLQKKYKDIEVIIYQPLKEAADELKEQLNDKDGTGESICISQMELKDIYVNFFLQIDDITLNFKFEILDNTVYNLEKYKRKVSELPYKNISDSDVYPQYMGKEILWWGTVYLANDIGYNIVAVKDTVNIAINLLKSDSLVKKQGDVIPRCLTSFEELYDKAVLNGWNRTIKVNKDSKNTTDLCDIILKLYHFGKFIYK